MKISPNVNLRPLNTGEPRAAGKVLSLAIRPQLVNWFEVQLTRGEAFDIAMALLRAVVVGDKP